MYDRDSYWLEKQIAFGLIAHVIALIPYLFYLATLQRTLKQIAPENRMMAPDQVWLSLIPGFRLFWCFQVVQRLGDSLQNELKRRGLLEFDDRPAGGVGIAMACLSIAFHLAIWAQTLFLTLILFLALLICWIIYWVKMAEYATQLRQSGPWHHYGSMHNPLWNNAQTNTPFNPLPGQYSDYAQSKEMRARQNNPLDQSDQVPPENK